MAVVGIDIIDMNEEAGVRHIRGTWRIEMVLRGDPMQPDGRISNADFGMDRLALRSSMDASCHEPEGLDQEVVCGRDVLIYQQRNWSLESWHEVGLLLFGPPIRPFPRRLTRATTEEASST
jgi:hypothetical protein